jgi:hypothetical protein
VDRRNDVEHDPDGGSNTGDPANDDDVKGGRGCQQ